MNAVTTSLLKHAPSDRCGPPHDQSQGGGKGTLVPPTRAPVGHPCTWAARGSTDFPEVAGRDGERRPTVRLPGQDPPLAGRLPGQAGPGGRSQEVRVPVLGRRGEPVPAPRRPDLARAGRADRLAHGHAARGRRRRVDRAARSGQPVRRPGRAAVRADRRPTLSGTGYSLHARRRVARASCPCTGETPVAPNCATFPRCRFVPAYCSGGTMGVQ